MRETKPNHIKAMLLITSENLPEVENENPISI